MQRCLFFLHRKGVDLRTFDIDVQQISHVSRSASNGVGGAVTATTVTTPAGGNAAEETKNADDKAKKKKKVDTLQLENAVIVACFLAHKARFIGSGIFSRIQKIRTSDATTVTEALLAVDYGGYWRKFREFSGERVQMVATKQ